MLAVRCGIIPAVQPIAAAILDLNPNVSPVETV
jgi:hypothetical protein